MPPIASSSQGLAGGDAWCPLTPTSLDENATLSLCEGVCGAQASCAGFTFYPVAGTTGAQCCFRTSVANMPPDPTSTAVCVARASAVPGTCTEDGPGGSGGSPLFMLHSIPSVVESYPPANSALRLWALNASSWAPTASTTYVANIAAANAAGAALYAVEYELPLDFGMADLSPLSWEGVAAAAATNASLFERLWRVHGKSYARAPACNLKDACADALLAYINGTGVDK